VPSGRALPAFSATDFWLGDTMSLNGKYRIANLAGGQYEVVFF
jgi:hypothetical protein